MSGSPLREQYLEAMGISLWQRRGARREVAGRDPEAIAAVPDAGPATKPKAAAPGTAPAAARRFRIGPGRGGTLLLCAGPAEAALPLAADVARCLARAGDDVPVWAWPDEAHEAALPLQDAIHSRLFTRVLSLGVPVAGVAPADVAVGSAAWLAADGVTELVRSAAARRALWARLRERGWCAG